MVRIKRAAAIILAEIPLLLLFLPKSRTGSAAAIAACVLLGVILLRRQKTSEKSYSFEQALFVLTASIFSGLLFYIRWQNTTRMKSLAVLPGMSAKQTCALIAAVLCLAFCFSLFYLLRFFPRVSIGAPNQKILDILYIFLLSAAVITLLSKCSPFYPFNDWVDPNTIFSVGKGMLRGKVPYRDLYEQKGPLLLALHAVAALISFDTMRGVWLTEITACFFTLLLLYRIMEPRLGRKSLAILPILALVIYNSRAFVAGDTAEEMSLPLLTYALFIGLKAIRENRMPSGRECFWIGVTSGCILWIKFSHLGFYAGWFIYFGVQALKEKKVSTTGVMLLKILCGVVTAAVPVFLYFGINHSIRIFLESYFINNIRYYPAFGAASGPFRHMINLWHGFQRFREANPNLLLFTAAGLLWCLLRKQGKMLAFMMLTMLSGFVVMFISGVSFPYYVFIFSSFAVFGAFWFGEIPALSRINLPAAGIVTFFLCVMGNLVLSENIYLLAYEQKDFPQYKVKEVIENSGIQDPTILHYGLLDAGFNLPAGLVPQQRFWCSFNLLLPEMNQAQDEYIEQGVTDFVITCHEPLDDEGKYHLVGTYPGDFARGGGASLFFLYQKND